MHQKHIFFLLILTLLTPISTYINPVQGTIDSPDPGVIYHNNSYYAVTTGGYDGHYFPIWRSSTGTDFKQVGWALPSPPSWTVCCDFWAPEIHLINGNFLLYYTARNQKRMLTIGAAISTNILGPYQDKG